MTHFRSTLGRIIARYRVALLTLTIMVALFALLIGLIALAITIHIAPGPKTAGGATWLSVIVGIYVAYLAAALMAAYVAVGVAERARGIWATKLFRPLIAKALALMFVANLGALSAVDLFAHHLLFHWTRIEADSDVRLLAEVFLAGLCAGFTWQLAALMDSFGWQRRRIVWMLLAILGGPLLFLPLLLLVGQLGLI